MELYCMKLLVSVDQRAAIRSGFECNSTYKVDVDISKLHQSVRNFVAERFYFGEVKQDPTDGTRSSKNDKAPMLVIAAPSPEEFQYAIAIAMQKAGVWEGFYTNEITTTE